MIADFFTKPLQGALFNRLKAAVMGTISIKEFMETQYGTKECVEQKNNDAPDVRPKILWSDVVRGRNVKRTEGSKGTNEMTDVDTKRLQEPAIIDKKRMDLISGNTATTYYMTRMPCINSVGWIS